MTVKDDISFQGNFDPSPESAERTEGWSHSQESGAFNQALLVSRISVTRLGDILDFGQLFKAFGDN